MKVILGNPKFKYIGTFNFSEFLMIQISNRHFFLYFFEKCKTNNQLLNI